MVYSTLTKNTGAILVAVGCLGGAAHAAHTGTLAIAITNDAGKPLPCRVHVLDSRGSPHRAGGLPFWKDHFVCAGEAKLTLPAGKYLLEIERGPEYARLRREVEVDADRKSQVDASLTRIADLSQQGWHSGDLHVHRAIEDLPLLMQAEDLHVAPVITWWDKRNLWQAKPLPQNPLCVIDGNRYYHLLAGEDERSGGALLFFNQSAPLAISQAEDEYPCAMKFVELARQKADAWIDIEKPFWWDVPVWLASGPIDSIGIANNHMCRSEMFPSEAWGKPRDTARLPAPKGNGYWSQEIYYQVLNCGLRIPPSAGSASGVLPNPVGYNRVYVHTGGAEGHFELADWWKGLKAGRSFVTNGPLLEVRAAGELPGHIFKQAGKEPLEIPLSIQITSFDKIHDVEIIQNGEIGRTASLSRVDTSNVAHRYACNGSVRFESSGWFLVRALPPNERTFRFASTAPYYVEIGDHPKRVSRNSARFFLNWVNERADQIGKKLRDPQQLEEVLVYHDRARTFWQAVLDGANSD